MTRHFASAALLALAALSHLTAHAAAEAGPHRQAVQFAKGASSAQLRGTLKGDRSVDYTVNARAGQTLAVKLQSSNGSLYFNINPPGSADVSMFIGNQQGAEAKLMLPADGTYVVRVYLMRNAARRHESATYTLDVAITGQALAPLSAAEDARVAGTLFHATAAVPCQTPGADVSSSCQAGVIRRGRDGTVTVELRGANGLVRNLLFVKREPVASDSPQPMSSSRQADAVTVRFGSDERYDVPDALLTGG